MKTMILRAVLFSALAFTLVACGSTDLTVQCEIEPGETKINDGYELLIDVVPWSRGLEESSRSEGLV